MEIICNLCYNLSTSKPELMDKNPEPIRGLVPDFQQFLLV